MPKVSPQRKLWVLGCYHPRAPEARHSMSHSYSNNYVHVVYSTANREDLIPPELEPRLYSFVAEIARKEGIPLIAAGGMPNHSHLLLLLPRAMALSIAINKLKDEFVPVHEPARYRFQLADGIRRFQCEFITC